MCKPAGQVAYLSRLRCADGRAPAFVRIGLSGYRSPRAGDDDYARSADQVRTMRPLADGETDLHPVDAFAVTCGDDEPRRVHLDMYHCAREEPTVAPPGMSLAAPEPPAQDASSSGDADAGVDAPK